MMRDSEFQGLCVSARPGAVKAWFGGRLLACAMVLLSGGVLASEPLFLRPSAGKLRAQAAGADEAPAPGYTRTCKVQINPPMLGKGSPLRKQAFAMAAAEGDLTLNLFHDRTLPVRITKTVSKGTRRYVSYGDVAGVPGSQIILSVNEGVISGSIFVPGEKTTQISYAGNGFHMVGEIDPEAVPACGAAAPELNVAPAVGGDIPRMAGDGGTRVDVLVLYTGAARTGAGGVTAMESLIDLAVAEANQAYANSEVNVDLNLVYRGEISYVESGSAETDLTRLQSSSDSYLQQAHTLRAQYGADVVILITEQMATYSGLAYIMSPPTSGFSTFAFGVVKRQTATGSYVFAHEVGHLFGCHHDRGNATFSGGYEYSHGHHLDVLGTTYRTVMAYAPGTRVPYFSNPDVNYLTVPTGVAAGETNSANNALTMNNTAAILAGFASEATLVNFELSSTNLTETSMTLTVNVRRTGDVTGSSTVQYSTVGITATAGSDYTATSGSLGFAAGETNQSVELVILDDSGVEASEVVRLVLSNPTNAVVGPEGILAVTIEDDDIGVSFTAGTATVGEDGGQIAVDVRRTGDSSPTVTVDYATADQTAVAGSDYTATNGTLSFEAGVTNLTLTLPILDDSDREANETFQVVLSGASGAALVSPSTVVITILEEDSTLSLSTNAVTVNENGGSAALTVLRTGGTNYAVTVDYVTSDDSATDGVDYTTATGTLSFAPGETSRTITVPILNDTDVDGEKSFTLSLSNAAGASLGGFTNAVVTILDSDSLFDLSSSGVTVAETAGSVALTVLRSGGAIGAASVRYTTTNASAVAGSDYTARNGVLSFRTGETSKTITIPIRNDVEPETNETFSVYLSSPTGEGALGTTDLATVTISDNDSLLSFETNEVSVAENGGTATLTVNRTGTLTLTNTFTYTVRAGTATTADYTAANGILTLLPGETNAAITIAIVDDSLVEATERLSIILSRPTGGALLSGTNTAYVNIVEDDAGLAFESSAYQADEGGTNLVLTVVQTGNTNGSPTVEYATSDLTAEAGSDYTATSGTLEFGPGTNRLTLTVPITEDSLVEGNERFQVSLSNVSGGILLSSSAVATILENDTVLALSTNAVTLTESAAGAVLTVVRSGGTNYAVTVDYATEAGTATNGVDYTDASGTLTFGPGVSSQTIFVPVLNDSEVDGDKTFEVILSNATGAALGATTNATATLLDNDSLFAFSTNAVSVSETAGSATLEVVRSGGLVGVATVRYGTTNVSAEAGSDYTARSGLLRFNPGEMNKTFSVTIRNDVSSETNEVFQVLLSSPTDEATLGETDAVSVTITDNDSLLSFASSTVTVGEGAGSATLTIERDGPLTLTNTISYTVRAGTATVADYTATNGTVTFLPGETNATLTIGIIDDSVVENDEVFSVQLTRPTGGALIYGTNTAYVTITENDAGLRFSATSYSVDEGGTNVVLTVVQSGDTNASPTVDYATVDVSAAAGTDYTATSGSLEFGPGTNSLTITLPITEDSEVETNETLQVRLSNVSGAILLATNATVTILENDTVLEFSTNALSALESQANATLTVRRSGGTNYSVTVDYFTADGTGTDAVDYTETTGTLTLGPGVASRTIAVPLLNDSVVDGETTFSLNLTNAAGAVLGTTTNATVTIQDNDSVFAFATNSVVVAETGRTVILEIVRSGGVVGAATVRYGTTNDTATAAADYTARSGILRFAAGETSKTISVSILNDAVDESSEVFHVVLSDPTGEGSLGAYDSVAVSIGDNDSVLSFSTNSVSVAEDAGSVTLTVDRTGTTTQTNTVAYAIRPGSATTADYTAGNGVLTFLPGDTNATITIPITNDVLVESDEAFTVVLSRPTGGALLSGATITTVTITEDDAGLGFSAATYSLDEGGTNVVLTVVQTGNTNASPTVDYATADVTAAAGSDYGSSTGTLEFGPGTNSLTITIPITEDSVLEANETFRVSLSGGAGGILLASNAVVTILENDTELAFSTNVVVFLEQAASAILTVVRAGGTNYSVTVDYATADGTGTNGVDYVSTDGTLTLEPGVASRTIIVPLLNDSDVDGDKTFTLSLANVSGATLGAVTNAEVTLLDNDSLFHFSTNAVTVAETERSVTVEVVRSGGLTGAATVRYGTTNDTAEAGSDYTARSGVLSFAAGVASKTFTISIANDGEPETNEVFNVVLSSPTGEGALGSSSSLAVTVTDNDSRLSWETNAVTVAENGGTATLTVNRTGTLTTTNTVNYTVRTGTARTTDYTASNGRLTFLPGETNAAITIAIIDDSIVETDEIFSVQLSSPAGGALLAGTNTAYVTISENDAGLEFSAATYSAVENGTNVTLTVVQSGNLGVTASVDYSMTDLGATDAADYTAASGTLNFGPGTNSLTIVVPILDDSELEANETFRVSLGNAGGASLLANSDAVVQILEDDSALAFSTNAVSVLENLASVTLTVVRSGGTNFPASIEFLTEAGSATDGEDYSSITNTTLSFDPGVSKRTIVIPLSNDSDIEGDEPFSLTLSNISGAITGAFTNVTVTILDNDSLFSFTTNEVAVAENAGTTVINVRRTGGLAAPATVRYATADGTATAGADYRARSGTLRFAAGQTSQAISISLLNDGEVDPGESFTVALSLPTAESALGADAVITLGIMDNDFAFGDIVAETGIEEITITALDWDQDWAPVIEVEGPVGAAIFVESSADLVHWSPVAAGVVGNEPFITSDPAGRDRRANFYRVRQAEAGAGE